MKEARTHVQYSSRRDMMEEEGWTDNIDERLRWRRKEISVRLKEREGTQI